SVNTITWFSERSGTASTGVRHMANSPPTLSAAANTSTRNRFLIENSMRRSIISSTFDRRSVGNALRGVPCLAENRNATEGVPYSALFVRGFQFFHLGQRFFWIR